MSRELQAIRGRSHHKPSQTMSPRVEPGLPSPPTWLSPIARKAWDSLARQFMAIGALTTLDGTALTMLVEAYRDLVEARDSAERGRAIKQLLTMTREFGAAPASRVRLSIAQPPAPLSPRVEDYLRHHVDHAPGVDA